MFFMQCSRLERNTSNEEKSRVPPLLHQWWSLLMKCSTKIWELFTQRSLISPWKRRWAKLEEHAFPRCMSVSSQWMKTIFLISLEKKSRPLKSLCLLRDLKLLFKLKQNFLRYALVIRRPRVMNHGVNQTISSELVLGLKIDLQDLFITILKTFTKQSFYSLILDFMEINIKRILFPRRYNCCRILIE